MQRTIGISLATFALLATVTVLARSSAFQAGADPQPQMARGVVFIDANGNRQRDPDEKPLAGVKVSNGVDIVATDAEGKYALPVSDDAIVFVLKPRGYRTPLTKQNLPQFYYVHKPLGSPKTKFPGVAATGPLPASIDFPLTPQEEPDQFKAVLFGDTQPRDKREVEFITHDIIEPLIGTDAAFGVTLGDIVFDDLSVFEEMNQAVALIGIPWYNVIGNHDINYDARNRKQANETYERYFGPSYYSFDYGPTHFIVLDDIEWLYDDGTKKGKYVGGIGPEQLAFVRRDLELIPADQMVVLMMHIPIIGVRDRHDLYRLIEQRPFCLSISGHTHHHEHRFLKQADGWMGPEPHHHIINVTACGSWWTGQPDERGIPHTMMADGAPNGHSILTFTGKKYTLDYVPAGRPRDYQMQIHLPETIPVGKLAETPLLVNIFNSSEKSTAEVRVGDGPWTPLVLSPQPDPGFVATREREASILAERPKAFRELPKPMLSPHLWSGPLPATLAEGTHAAEVRTTDMSGRTFTARRLFRVVPNPPVE
jgi:hypothetical protein